MSRPDDLRPVTASATDDVFANSRRHRERASQVLPRGVSSTPRAAQRPVPLAIAHAEGAHVTDVDGRTYIDYAMGYGPLILGHSPQVVLDAVRRELALGLRVGSVTRPEVELGERLARIVPSAQLSAFLSTGTEAVQLALRVARARTGRLPVIKFRCHYHGWSDVIHAATDIGRDGPATTGQDPDALRHVSVLDWGDAGSLAELLQGDVAAVIMEPAAINAGCFAPPDGYLQQVRDMTIASGTALIFDEVITGFRLGLGGAQQRYGVTPDLTVLGKALGAGLPISAVSGSADMMAPLVSGGLSQRGTYNGNPLSAAAAVACVDYLEAHADSLFPRLDAYASSIATHVRQTAARIGVNITANCVGPCVQLFAGATEVGSLADLRRVDKEATLEFTALLLGHGIATLPRGIMYLSAAHTGEDIERTLHALAASIAIFAHGHGPA